MQEGENINLLGTWRQSNPLVPAYTRLDGTRPASRDHYRDPCVCIYSVMRATKL